MYSSRWFLFLCFCFSIAFAGNSQKERIFIDYGACTKGLIAANGDTVIPANYEYLGKARIIFPRDFDVEHSKYWHVQSGEEQGLFDENYKVVIPFGYYQISILKDSIVMTVTKDTVAQLHHSANHKIKSNSYNNITFAPQMDSIFIAHLGDSTHILDLELKIIQKLPYAKLYPYTRTAKCDYTSPKFIFHADSAEYSGYISREERLSVLSKNEHITPIRDFTTRCVQNRDLYFIMQDSLGKYGLRNLTGSVFLPNEFDRIQVYLYQRIPEDTNTLAFAYLWKNNSMQVQELHSGKTSRFYNHVQYYEGYHVAVLNDKSFMLDEQLNVIDSLQDIDYLFKTNRDYVLRNYNEDFPNFDNIRYDSRLRRNRNIVFVGEPNVSSKKRRKARIKLYNFQSGESTEQSYNGILLYPDKQGEIYYHAVKNKWSKYWFLRKRYLRHSKVTIYDSSFNIVSNYTGRTMYDLTAKGTGALILENKHKKQGVISIQGDTIIPFEYDRIRYREMSRYSMEVSGISAKESRMRKMLPAKVNDSFFVVTNRGKKGMYDLKGQVLIPEIYKNLQIDNGSVIAYTDTVIYHFDCCDTIKEVYQSEFGKPLIKPKRRKFRKCRKQKKQPKNKLKFFEEDGIYYVYSPLYDSTWRYRTPDQSRYREFVERDKRIINENSEVVYKTKEKRVEIYSVGATSFFFDGDKVVFLDSTGILKEETFPKEQEAEIYNDRIIVNNKWDSKKRFSGMYSIDKLSWILPIEENLNIRIEDYRVVIRGSEEDGYLIYDKDGTQRVDYVFPDNYSVNVGEDYIVLWMYDTNEYHAKVALLDTNFNYILQPSYGEIERVYSKVAEYRDTNNNLTLINGTKKLSFPKVKIKYASDGIYLFKLHDSIAYIDYNLNVEMPFTFVNDLFTKERLKSIYFNQRDTIIENLTGVQGVNLPIGKRDLIENLTLSPYLKDYHAKTKYSLHQEFKPSKPVIFDTISVPVRHGRQWIGKGSYQVRFSHRRHAVYNNIIHRYEYYDTTYRRNITRYYDRRYSKKKRPVNYTFEYHGVRIDTSYLYLTDTALVPLPNFKYVETENRAELRALLLKKLNEVQALGLRCANIERELNHLESNFNINENGILFWGVRNQHSITIPYFELIGIWKNPYVLKLDQLLDESP